MGGSVGKSSNKGGNTWSNNVWGPQGEALGQLYDKAFEFFDQTPGGAVEGTDKIFNTATGAWEDQAAGGAYGDSADIRDRLFNMMGGRSNVGSMYESIVGGPGNTYIDPLVESMRSDASQNLATLQSGNALDAAALGQSGSSRQAMENAMLGSEVNRALSGDINQARAGAYDRDLAMKMGIAQQADASKQAEQDRLFDMLTGANQAQTGAISNMGNMMGGALGSQNAWFNPLMNLANIIGGPIMTGSGSSSSKGKGFGTGGGLW